MRQSFLNIERHRFQKCTNVGYGGGIVWIIKRVLKDPSQWCAKPLHNYDHAGNPWIYGRTLEDISKQLEALDHAKKQHMVAGR